MRAVAHAAPEHSAQRPRRRAAQQTAQRQLRRCHLSFFRAALGALYKQILKAVYVLWVGGQALKVFRIRARLNI
jgi:hypothetical protein